MSLAAARALLEQHEFPFADLPTDRQDPLWPQIALECGLSLAQLSALKNERCSPGANVAASSSASASSSSATAATTAASATSATTESKTKSGPPPTYASALAAPTTALESYAEEDQKRQEACGEALQGYLLKQGSGILGAGFKKRFVLLQNYIIQYFSDDSRNVLKGEIFLRSGSTVAKSKDGVNPFAFALTPVHGGRVYHFAGKDAAERDQWITAIKGAIDHCENARKQLCLVGSGLRRLQQNRVDDDALPASAPALMSQISSLSHGTLLIKCKGEWEEQEWRIDDDKLVFPEAGIRYSLLGVAFKIMPEQEHGPLVLGLKRKTDGHGLLLRSQTRPRLKKLSKKKREWRA